jgi:hypothetical protein
MQSKVRRIIGVKYREATGNIKAIIEVTGRKVL